MTAEPTSRETGPATVRSHVLVPIGFADGFSATARIVSFDGLVDGREHVAIGLGDRAETSSAGARAHPPDLAPTVVRLHSECLTGDVFGSGRCDCGAQLRESVERLSATGGYLLYLRQEGRGIGLYPKLDAYVLQDSGLDTYDANVALGFRADERDYTVAAQMLGALGVTRIALLSNNPDKVRQLRALGVTVTSRVPTGVHLSRTNAAYLRTKARRGAHALDLPVAMQEVGSGSG
ncbi:GTP cyclohydrolase II [Terrabacter sp. NPDC000476]|uniref:GTP cyclohydrolase II n=1 Tax=Terrabacter sp. NPDC000476 TaxID=3154258 RepID=UPI00331E0866